VTYRPAIELITRAAIVSTPLIRRVLDIGCGAGNNTFKLREVCGYDFAAEMLDPSQLVRAKGRLSPPEDRQSAVFVPYRESKLWLASHPA
jgi:trans-aconitate methyltransferase